jgi:hypothetical protein
MEDNFERALTRLAEDGQLSGSRDREAALLALSQRYSYVYPSPAALAMLSEFGPIVEVAAGTGYWAQKLRSLGVDIVAYDQAPPDGGLVNRYHAKTGTWLPVLEGDQTVLSRHSDRTLFLCWPPLYSSLGDCLSYYQGRAVAYIGDGGLRTARLDRLEETFTKVSALPVRALDPDPEAAAALTIWRRGPAGDAGQLETRASWRRGRHAGRDGCSAV